MGDAYISEPRTFNYDIADANLTGFASNVTGATWTLTTTATSDGIAHQVSIRNDSVNDKSAIAIVLVGTDADGNAQTESVTGPGVSATVESALYYKTLTSATPASTWGADTADIGWVDEIASPLINLNYLAENVALINADVTGTIDFTLQQTFDKFDDASTFTAPSQQVQWVTVTSAQTADGIWNTTGGATAMRLIVNSYSSGAEIQLNVNPTKVANAPSGGGAVDFDVNVAQWGGTATTLGQKTMAASVPVVIASNQSAISVTGTFTGSTTPSDNFANPTTAEASFALAGLWDGATWDRWPGTSALGGSVNLIASGGNVLVADNAVAGTTVPLPVGGNAIAVTTDQGYTAADRATLSFDLSGNALVGLRGAGSATAIVATTTNLATADNVLGVTLKSGAPIAPATAIATRSQLIGVQYNATLPTATDGQQLSYQSDANGRMLVVATGNVASGVADAGNPLSIGAIFETTPSIITTGQRTKLHATSSGVMLSTISNSLGTGFAVVTNAGDTTGTNAGVWTASQGMLWNNASFDRTRSVITGTDSIGTGIAAAGILAQFDDTSPSTVTENQFGNLRMSSARSLYVQDGPYVYGRAVADTQIKATAGFIHTINIAPIGTVTAGVLTVYDSAAESGTVIYSVSLPITAFVPFSVDLNVACGTGIYVAFDATLANVQATVSYR